MLEIGPGRGALTELLVERAGRLILVEVDRDLAALLREKYAAAKHVEVVEGDVLTMDLAALAGGHYRLVGNIPYNITTPIVFHSLRSPRPELAVFLVQREVADRLAAREGSREYGALSVNVQTVAQVESLGGVPAGAFHPKPKVDSAIVRLRPLEQPLLEPNEEEAFRRFVIGLFGQRRRQIVRALRTVTDMDAVAARSAVETIGIDPSSRCEELAPAKFVLLFRICSRASGSGGESSAHAP